MKVQVLRCPECRTRRKDPRAMILHIMQCKRPLCHCLRVHHPHRPGSYPLCEQNPMSDALIAALMGADEDLVADVIADIAFNTPGKVSKACPF